MGCERSYAHFLKKVGQKLLNIWSVRGCLYLITLRELRRWSMQSIDLPVFFLKNDTPSIREVVVLFFYALSLLSLFHSVIINRKRLWSFALGEPSLKAWRSASSFLRRKVGACCFVFPSDLTYLRGLSPWVIGYGSFAVPSDLTYSARILKIYRVYFSKRGAWSW